MAFETISEELVEYAELAAARLRASGYQVREEPHGAYYPVTPTLAGSSQQREFIVEVGAKVDSKRIRKWVAYGKAQSKETKVALVFPPQPRNVAVSEIEAFQAAGVGLWIANGAGFVFLVQPRDLASEVLCPDTSGDSAKVRKKVQPCFDKVTGGEAIDGFKDLAVIVEASARRRLIEGIRSGRITFASAAGNPITYAAKDIKKGTMGWLRDRHKEIVSPNGADNLVLQAFNAVLKDRNLANHTDLTASQRRALKARIPKHLLVLHRAAKAVI